MTLTEKLDKLDLNPEERIKAEEKFLASLALVTDEELEEVVSRLKSFGISITKARELKIIPNSSDEIAKKFSILGEIHETDLYKEDPRRINLNVIDIYKRIKYCKQTGRSYKTEDGGYKSFLFSEGEWQNAFTQTPSAVDSIGSIENEKSIDEGLSLEKNDDVVTLEPLFNPEVNNDFSHNDPDHIDINEYMKANRDAEKIAAETTNFANIRKELEDKFAELDNIKSFNPDDVISFNDIEVENYGMGR